MNNPLEDLSNEALMEEVRRRGLLQDLHGAVGALYDHMASSGAMDGDMSAYLAYRLRREDAKLGSRDGESAAFWQQKVDSLDSDGPGASDQPAARQDIIESLATMVLEQAEEHGFPVEVDAVRDAVDQFCKFSNIDATEEECVAASELAIRKASDVVIVAELFRDGVTKTVEFNAQDVLKHNEETRTWQELTLDDTHQHLQLSLAEDYALYEFRRRHGDNKAYEVTILEGLSEFERDDEVVVDTLRSPTGPTHG